MKPRYDEAPLLRKAIELEERLNTLIKAKECPTCKSKDCVCKSKDCPSCGEKLDKAGMCKMRCDKMEKAEPGFKSEKITDINPSFHAESGGQTKSGYFTTNGRTIETEDAKPKRKKDSKDVDMKNLGSKMNPHEGTGVEREDSAGESKPLFKAGICGACGATESSGCLLPQHGGMSIQECPSFQPL